MDCCNQGADVVKAKGYPHCNYITLNSPLLKNIDEHGLIFGAVKNLGDLLKHNIPVNEKKSIVKWGFFAPSPSGINQIQQLVENKKVTTNHLFFTAKIIGNNTLLIHFTDYPSCARSVSFCRITKSI